VEVTLVERLRRTVISAADINGGRRQVPLNPDGLEAADEIERLTAALAAAEEALREIAAYNDEYGNERLARNGSYSAFDEPWSVKIARAALETRP
jgi:hypothetical protein